MQLPPVERNVNWPPAAVGAQLGGGAAAVKPVTTAIQEETVKVEAVKKPEPSVKVDISATLKEIVALETAARARASGSPAAKDKADGVDAVDGVATTRATAKTQVVNPTADSAKTTHPLDKESPETAAKAAKLLAGGKEPGPNQPQALEEDSKDWTVAPKAAEKKVENPPPEPISKKLLDFLQQLWRAGGNAVDVAHTANQTLNPDKLAEGPLTYDDPSAVKKTTGV
jgi:hypothetical protein